MVLGAVIVVIGCFVPWLSGGGFEVNGFDDVMVLFDERSATGPAFVFFAVVLLGLGVTTLAAKRLLAITIIGIVVGALSLLGAVAEIADYQDFADATPVDLGPGLPVIMLGSAVSLGGAIAGCAKRRR